MDALIPPAGSFPAPSDAGVLDEFVAFCLADEGPQTPDRLPAPVFAARLDGLADEVTATGADVAGIIARLERDDAVFFRHLLRLTYYGYYSRPAVVAAMRRELPAARDYEPTPQPRGYTR